jgi:hypothetical protein
VKVPNAYDAADIAHFSFHATGIEERPLRRGLSQLRKFIFVVRAFSTISPGSFLVGATNNRPIVQSDLRDPSKEQTIQANLTLMVTSAENS